MAKYLIKRIITGLLSAVAVVALVMILVYSLLNRDLVFATDTIYNKQANNQKVAYRYQKWEEYGYVDYITYSDYLSMLLDEGEIDEDTRSSAVSFGRTAEADSELVAAYVEKFTEYYESRGYTVTRLDAIMQSTRKLASGGQQQLFAYKDVPLVVRLVKYFCGLITVDNIHNVEEDVGERGLTFTWYDPVYGGDVLSPAIMGNGTTHKYLFWVSSSFPFIHQNLVTINLGTSYTVNAGVDVFTTMTRSQGSYVTSTITYPSGLTEESADDLHSATYVADSLGTSLVYETRYTDDYTNVQTMKKGHSKIGYSFIIGILSVLFDYVLGVPLGILMARKKDSIVDQLGTFYVVFILAVPSLAYIFLFKGIGGKLGLPTTFDVENGTSWMYVLPILSLTLPSVASLMKWLRRYMIDQMNADYVKFARAGGLTENEIFSRHIFKNASIPILQGIPGSVLFALTGAIITERVYVVPGAGGLLTNAIAKYDNGVIIGLTLFYALLSVISIILGDVLMSIVDPRISFTSKDR